jgi:hypothetical protein
LLGEEQKWLAHARYDAIELGCVKTRKPEKGRERLFSAQPKSNALINLQACKRDLEERLFYRRRSSPRFLHSQDPTPTLAVQRSNAPER